MARRSNETATFFAQKKLLGKAHTSNLLTDAGEAISTNVQLASTTVFGEAIPTNPSKTLNTGQGVGAGAKTVEYVEFALEALDDSIYDANATGGGSGTESGESSQTSGHHAYAFKFKSTYQSDTDNARNQAGNGNFDNNKKLFETLGAVQLVPFNFSGENNNPYVVQIYKDNGSGAAGDEIFLLANIDWQVDTYNGILFVQDFDSSQIPAFARAFVYIGDMVDSVIAAGGGAGGTVAGSDTQVQFNDGGSAFGGDSGLVFNKTTNTLTTDNLSGSLTQLSDGTSYLVAGHNVTITSASNGQVTIASAITELSEDTSPVLGGQLVTGDHKIAFGTGDNTSEIDFTYNGGGNFTSIASVKSIDMFLDLNGGDSGQKFRIFNNLQPRSSHDAGTNTDTNAIFMVREEGNVFTKGFITASMGFSGSLTQLTDGTSYLVAGDNVTITSASNGQVTIASTQVSPAGSDTQIQFNDGGSFGASSAFTFDDTTVKLHAADPSLVFRRTDNAQNCDINFQGQAGVVGAQLRFSGSASNDLVFTTFTGATLKERLRIRSNTADVVIEATGSLSVTNGISGSLTKLVDGTSYILSNGSISVTTQSNGSIVLSAANSVFNEYIGEADGSNTRFTLDHAPTANKNVSVFVNGQLQMPATNITGAPFQDFSVTGSVVFFVTASLPPKGSVLMANYTTNQSIS